MRHSIICHVFLPISDELPEGTATQCGWCRGDRIGQHSIRINDQYRICFVWTDTGPDEVEVTDYH